MKAVILAGGKGTRLSGLYPGIPKPMVPVGGIPIVEHQVALLKRYHITDILMLTGYGADIIENHFQTGEKFGVSVSYYRETTPLGTTGGIKAIEALLAEDFMVLYGDVMINMSLQKLINFHSTRNSQCTLALHPNDHPFDSDLVEINSEQKIIAFHPKPHEPDSYYRNLVNAGVYIMSPHVLRHISRGVPADFGRDIFPGMVDKANMFGYVTAEYLKDAGTPERLEEVNRDYARGKIAELNIENKRKAIFIDRDGVINKEVGLLCKIEDFELLPDTPRAIRKINESAFLAVVATNQSVVARNLCSVSDIEAIHNKMETLLGRERAKLDAIYYCPHHPDKGYPEENAQYKIDCACRKPKTGLIDTATKDFNIDISGSFFIGDSWRDIASGKNAGATTVGLRTGYGCKDGKLEPDYFFDTLYEAAAFIIEEPFKEYFDVVYSKFIQTKDKRPYIIAIGGNSRSGKTVLARYLHQRLNKLGTKGMVISLDNWLLSHEKRKQEYDVYDRFQLYKINEDMGRLFRGEEVILKKYHQLSSKPTEESLKLKLLEEGVIIIDGVVALSSEAIRNISDIKIFCDIDNTLLKKRIVSFYQWKGYNNAAIESLLRDRKNDEYDLIKQDSACADIIVKTKGSYQ